MYSLLVLGLIPGTNIQINFQFWLGMTTVAVGAFLLFKFSAKHRQAIVDSFTPRTPLHASQLHQRN